MKKLSLIAISFLFINFIVAQEKFTVPELSTQQKTDILYNHVIAYAVAGISFAKTQGVTPELYGKYIGKKFTSFWKPEAGFYVFVKGMLDILSGINSNNEMQIISQSEKMIQFKLKNVDLSFQKGPMLGVTYNEFLECSNGIISVLSEHMNVKFSHKISDEIWYEATFEKKNN